MEKDATLGSVRDHFDSVAVIDLVGRAGQHAVRTVRRLGVFCHMLQPSFDGSEVENVRGVIMVTEDGSPKEETARRLEAAGLPFVAVDGAWREWDEDALSRVLFEAWGCQPRWSMANYAAFAKKLIRGRVGGARVLSALSGGVDSAVASRLVHSAIGEQLTCIFVDHGFLRKGEGEQVVATFSDAFGSEFIHVDAQDRFLDVVAGISDPEEKRKRIGQEFIRVFEEEARKLGDIDFLVQGTLYPDVMESGVGAAAVKSHHNVGGLPEKMNLQLIEPLRFLFKDEVRVLGEALGLPPFIVQRQPFPGPGLAIRIMGVVDRHVLEVEREADAIVVEEIERAGLRDRVWQYFAVVTDARSVGVDEKGRTYGYVAAVRAVEGEDGMSATWARLPYELLDRIAQRMMTEIPDITRVVYDISNKPPSTIEWE